MAGEAIPLSTYRLSTSVDFMHPVILRHVWFRTLSCLYVYLGCYQTDAVYFAVGKQSQSCCAFSVSWIFSRNIPKLKLNFNVNYLHTVHTIDLNIQRLFIMGYVNSYRKD